MQNIKISIKDLFNLIEKEENHKFIIGEEYHQNKKLQVLGSNNEFCNIKLMIIKEDLILQFIMDDESIIKIGSKHIIINDSLNNIFAKDLKVGDFLFNYNNSKEIKEIKVLDNQLVYDIMVDAPDHLYFDDSGFLHHNTYVVSKILGEVLGPKGKKWNVNAGKASPLGMYGFLFANRNKVVVFDDCDSVFNNEDSVNILKAALDSGAKREVSWISTSTISTAKMDSDQIAELYDQIEDQLTNNAPNIKYPDRFEFTGKVIFISNLNESKIDPAIKSRSFVIDITLDNDGILSRMKQVLPHLCAGSSMQDKEEVLNFLLKEGDKLNMRTFVSAIRVKESGNPRWMHIVSRYA